MQDRSPLKFDGRWLWYNRDHELADSGNHADHLPAEVFGLLSGFLPRENQKVTELVKSYPTREAAMSAYREASEAAATPTETDIQAALDFGRTADQHLR